VHHIAQSDSGFRSLMCLTQWAFGFLIITFKWVVWLRNDFTSIVLTHVDTSQPIFNEIRKTINQPCPSFVNVPVPPPLISKINCSWPITNHKPHQDIKDTWFHRLTVQSTSTRSEDIPLKRLLLTLTFPCNLFRLYYQLHLGLLTKTFIILLFNSGETG